VSFPDSEMQLAMWIKAHAPGVVAVGSSTPLDLESRLIFVRVSRLGGGADLLTDYPQFDVDVFGPSRDAAFNVAGWIQENLVPRTRLTPGGAIIDSVRTNTSPRLLPWDNTKIKRFSATYALGLRR
jgi:hypothetical protein